jgi:hypothetical protein
VVAAVVAAAAAADSSNTAADKTTVAATAASASDSDASAEYDEKVLAEREATPPDADTMVLLQQQLDLHRDQKLAEFLAARDALPGTHRYTLQLSLILPAATRSRTVTAVANGCSCYMPHTIRTLRYTTLCVLCCAAAPHGVVATLCGTQKRTAA